MVFSGSVLDRVCLAGGPRVGPSRGGEEAKWAGRWGIWRRVPVGLSTWEQLLGPLPRQCSPWAKDAPGQGLSRELVLLSKSSANSQACVSVIRNTAPHLLPRGGRFLVVLPACVALGITCTLSALVGGWPWCSLHAMRMRSMHACLWDQGRLPVDPGWSWSSTVTVS